MTWSVNLIGNQIESDCVYDGDGDGPRGRHTWTETPPIGRGRLKTIVSLVDCHCGG